MSTPAPLREKAQTRWMMGQRRQGGMALGLAVAAPLLGGALLLWQAWTLADILGRAVEMGEPMAALMPAILLVATLLVGRTLLGMIGERAGAAAGEAIKLHVRQALFGQLLSRSPRAGDQPASGAAASVVIDQTEALDGFFARYFPAMIQATILPLAFGAVILPLDWLAGLLFLVTAPLIPLFMALAGWGAQIATERQATALSRLSGRFADRLRGMLTLKLFGRADAETAGIVAASDELRRRTLKVLRIAFLSSAVLEFFAALGVAGIALYVGLTFIEFLHLRSTPLTLQAGLFLLLMAPEIYNPLRLLAAHYHDRAAAKAAIAEIEKQLGALPEAIVPLADAKAPSHTGALAVRIDGLTLRTPDRSRTILSDVALTLEPGQHLAIVGPSGIGKTTLLEAIGRLRAHEGEIGLDGLALQDWPEAELRGRVAVLGQKPRIFHGSIAQNIGLGRPGASRAEIARAAELAHVAAFADALPDGLDTLLGEDGVGLSGGQVQRVALARIFLRDAGLILLDEPTAHLDGALEGDVMDTLISYAAGRTLIIATHSMAAAGRMDRAYRIAAQSLVEMPLPHRRDRKGSAA
ncbi:thiol reductant ABC exporter subunit CydD [Devosia limi]|nr:thiol reductant ABC exporter subunit CydD [Devosia limi]SHE52900.1 ATP-binding cassette, subfamily C, CydD [Devosia limi DSM 17137]